MQTIVAGLMALTAMGASILSDVDPVTTVVRGAVAFVVGMILSSVWTMAVVPGEPKKSASEDSDEHEEVESVDETDEHDVEVEEVQAA